MKKTYTMKKILLSFVLFAGMLSSVSAQKALQLPATSVARYGSPALTHIRKPSSGLEPVAAAPVSIPASAHFLAEQAVGVTTYDLQSNSSIGRRLHVWDDGEVSATWCMSRTGAEANGFPDRGTGYNISSGGTFGPLPATRIEGPAIRTGAPNYFVTESGEEWVTSHTGTIGAYIIHYAHKSASATTWTQGNVPTTTPNGGLWARACAGGPDNNTIHLIYYTTPAGTSFEGAPVDGIDGTVKYCRSLDGGQNWDKIDISLPGLTSDQWVRLPAEGYQIDANGNDVAIAIFSQTNDCLLFKSTDNGDTWQPARIVNDFPLDKWSFDDGYTFEQVGAFYDETYYPDSLALLTTDETGTVMVDDNGMAHVWFSSLFVSDADSTDDGMFTWWPAYDLGIIYWNESMADNNGIVAAFSPDLDGDGVWGNDDSQNYTEGYGEAFSTGPSAGIDADGRLYLAFTTNHELFFDFTDFYHHRHPFIVRTAPGDFTAWQTPQPVLNEQTYSDPEFLGLYEHYFTSMARKVDDQAHVLVQQDGGFGLALRLTGNQPAEENSMLYVGFPLDMFAVGADEPGMKKVELSVSPNPVSSLARIRFAQESGETYQLEVFNLLGDRVHVQQIAAGAGDQTVTLPVQHWPSGAYLVRLLGQTGYGSAKIVKE